LHVDLSSFTRSIVVLFEVDLKDVGTLIRAADLNVGGNFTDLTLLSVFDGLSNNEGLLVLELEVRLKSRFQNSFELVGDVSEVLVTLLMERAGNVSGEHESEGNGVLTRQKVTPGVDGDVHLDKVVLFLVEGVLVDEFSGGKITGSLGFLSFSDSFSLDDLDKFSTLELKEELVTRVGDEEVEVNTTSDSFTAHISGLVGLEEDLTESASTVLG